METDRRYLVEGLFIVGLAIAGALFFVWLAGAGHRDDVTYRIHFAESVSGLALGDPVKFRGVEVGTVSAMAIDAEDPRFVAVDVRLRKDAPVKTDTRASLQLKGITGTVYIELNGGGPQAQSLLAATPEGGIPEIPSEKSSVASILEQLPRVVERFAAIEDRVMKVATDVGRLTSSIKEDPSQLVWGAKDRDKDKGKDRSKPSHAAR